MKKPDLAWASPLPPTRSGIADYAAEIIPEIRRRARLTLVAPPGWDPRDSAWAAGLPTIAPDAPAPGRAIELLHLGNNPYHIWVAQRLRSHGGVVVLHDTVLHHLLVEEAAAEGDWRRFGDELADAHGRHGRAVATAREWGYEGRLDPFLFSMRHALLRYARGVIVHNDHALAQVQREFPGLPARHVPLAVAALPAGDRAVWRTRLGAAEGEVLLAHLGFLSPAKGFEVMLRALVALRELGVRFRFVVVGEGSESAAFAARATAAGIGERIVHWGYATAEDLGGIAAATDLGLVPRFPTAGETSATVLRFFAAGTPAIVTGYGQFLEFPAEAAPRIAPGRSGIPDLVRWVERFACDGQLRSRSRTAAKRAWKAGGHAPEEAAHELVRAAQEIADDVA